MKIEDVLGALAFFVLGLTFKISLGIFGIQTSYLNSLALLVTLVYVGNFFKG